MMDLAVGANAAGKAVAAIIPVPVISDISGWAVADAIHWIVQRARAIAEHPKHCRKLLELLESPRLLKAVHALDQLTDLPQFQEHRPDYALLCDTLEEAAFVLVHASAGARGPGSKAAALRGWWDRVVSSDKPKDLRRALLPFCEMDKYLQLYTTLQQMPRSDAPCVRAAEHVAPLQPYRGPAHSAPRYSEPALLPHVFQHGDSLVPRIDKMLKTTRHVGVVGMGGIGKTTIARAAFEHARPRFDAAVWLTVGAEAADMLPLLRAAFAELFPGAAVPFQTAAGGLQDLTQRLFAGKRSVLLVLDDVWPSTQHAVLAALNFATPPSMRDDQSRLIVTTRDRNTLSYQPRGEGTQLMDELEVVEPPLLDAGPARQLFNHHALRVTDMALPAFVDPGAVTHLIAGCGGNPLALQVLGATLRHCTTAEQWEARLAAERTRRARGDDAVTRTCAASVDILPPSIKECFVEFAAFPEDARVPEADLLHLFATRAPLHTLGALRVAASKLRELVHRSLVAKTTAATKSPTYHMHDILRSIALRHAGAPESGRSFCGAPTSTGPPGRVRSFSSHKPVALPDQLASRFCEDVKRLRACIICDASGESPSKSWPTMRRLRYLWLQGDVGALAKLLSAAKVPWPVLEFVRLSSGHPSAGEFVEALLPAIQLAHLDVSLCTSLAQLPESIGSCSQLVHLNLEGCASLVTLPESIGGCGQLTRLNLTRCKRLARLPQSIGSCARLQDLSLKACSGLTHLPQAIGECSQLRHLNISECEGLSELPESIGGCGRLAHLDVWGCEFLTQLPESIGDCSELASIDLSLCESLSQLPESIGSCARLARLDLTECEILSRLPESIGGCSQLTYLNLTGCTGDMMSARLERLPDRIGDCRSLQCLHLERCRRLKTLPDTIGGCRELRRLVLTACLSLTHLPDSIRDCRQLAHLELPECERFVQLPDGIGGCDQLTYLTLRACVKLVRLPESLAGCSRLAELDLRGCERLAQLPDSVGSCDRLTRVDLGGCSKLSALPDSIARCSALVHLDISCTEVMRLPERIGGCGQLSHLNLKGCTLAELPERIGECRQLAYLSLWGNVRVAQLPESIGRCSQLTHVDLWGCKMLPALPESIGDCGQLRTVDVRSCDHALQVPPLPHAAVWDWVVNAEEFRHSKW